MGNLDDPRMPYDYSKREYGTLPPDDRKTFRWVSEIAYKNVHRIVARGYDTTELMEEGYGVVDMLFIDFQARIPLIEEEKMLNYIMILGLEDGLSLPAVVARTVAQSKTFLTQACGASILAFGHAYGAYSAFGNMLEKYLGEADKESEVIAQAAEEMVKENLDNEALGVSGLMLKDPSAKRLIARAEKLAVAGKYVAFMKAIVKAAQKIMDKPVDIDMLGAIGAVMLDLGFSAEATWAIMATTRAFACGAHYIEEVERQEYSRMGQTLSPKENYDGPAERPVPPLEDRDNIAKPAQTHTTEEWKKAFTERQKVYGTGYGLVEEIEDPSKKTGVNKTGKLV
jgi:citrate synthase